MIHVLCRAPSEGAAVLVSALRAAGGTARRARNRLPVAAGDKVICWGQSLSRFELPQGVQIFNRAPLRTKVEELRILDDARIGVPEFRRQAPPDPVGWIPRRLHHQDSQDFFSPPQGGEVGFWTRRVQIAEEWRFHIFGGRSLRSARKIPLLGETNVFHYSHVPGPEDLRRISIRAVRELGLEFGAVDIIRTNDLRSLVLEVNRRPGLDPNGRTAERYARAFLEG